MSYSKDFKLRALRQEIESLRPMLPQTPATERNLAAIYKWKALDAMDESELCTHLDLFARSIPELRP